MVASTPISASCAARVHWDFHAGPLLSQRLKQSALRWDCGSKQRSRTRFPFFFLRPLRLFGSSSAIWLPRQLLPLRLSWPVLLVWRPFSNTLRMLLLERSWSGRCHTPVFFFFPRSWCCVSLFPFVPRQFLLLCERITHCRRLCPFDEGFAFVRCGCGVSSTVCAFSSSTLQQTLSFSFSLSFVCALYFLRSYTALALQTKPIIRLFEAKSWSGAVLET